MKRRQLTLLLLLMLGIALWLARRWWLPPLLAQVPILKRNSDLIQSTEALVSLVGVVGNLALGYLLWLSHQTSPKSALNEMAALRATSPASIREGLGQIGGNVNWIDRQATTATDLQHYGRLALVGRTRQGKTREAAELILRALTVDLVSAPQVYQPGPALRFLADASLRQAIEQQVDQTRPVLLFVDDLPYHYATAADLARLSTVLAALQACKSVYVLITAREDHLTADHNTWLTSEHFHRQSLPDLTATQTGQLVDNAAGLLHMQVSAAARQALIDHNNGTPEVPLMALKTLYSQGITQVDDVIAAQIVRQYKVVAWVQTRRETIEPHQPGAGPLLDALAHFHAARVRKQQSLVLAYAAGLPWPASPQPGLLASGRWWLRWSPRYTLLRRALYYLRHFDIVVQDGVIVHPDQVVEVEMAAALPQQQVGDFLQRHRRWLHNRWLRRFHRQREAQRWALFDLALTYAQQQKPIDAVRYYTTAIAVEAHFGFYNNRGIARSDQGKLDEAIADYDEAIRLNPTYATAYNNRGIARKAQGKLDEAIADYDEAIRLNPTDATAYNNRGIARKAQGKLDEAIADYDEAIRLNPTYATAYNNRGIARSDQGKLDEAIADYDEAIRLNPTDATAFYNRGNARKAQGKLDEAIADYDEAIRRSTNPRHRALIYRNLGNAHRQLERWSAASAAYQQVLDLEKQRLWDWLSLGNAARHLGDEPTQQNALQQARTLAVEQEPYTLACLESIAGNDELALEWLAQAVIDDPQHKVSARQEANLHWVRDNPRFVEIVNAENAP